MISLRLKKADEAGNWQVGEHLSVSIGKAELISFEHPEPEVDLIALPIGPLLQQLSADGKRAYYRAITPDYFADDAFASELTAVEEITMVGYPTGLWDERNNLPIVRRGITATPVAIDFEGRQEFLIDCACFPGSSGSPVFLVNQGSVVAKDGGIQLGGRRVRLLGILYAGPQYDAKGRIEVRPVPTAFDLVVASQVPINLGFCIKAKRLTYFDAEFSKRLAA